MGKEKKEKKEKSDKLAVDISDVDKAAKKATKKAAKKAAEAAAAGAETGAAAARNAAAGKDASKSKSSTAAAAAAGAGKKIGTDGLECWSNFCDAPFSAPVMAVIKAAGFPAPSPIQQHAWPVACAGKDAIAVGLARFTTTQCSIQHTKFLAVFVLAHSSTSHIDDTRCGGPCTQSNTPRE
jgi:hypothetical protein